MNDSKKIGPFLATMVVASTMIGSGVYLLPASLAAIGSITILAWLAATAGAALIGGVFVWLAILSPGTRGLFSYIRDAFGPLAGFVVGALYWASCIVAAVAIALAATGYLGALVPAVATQTGMVISTVALLWLFIGANMLGPRFVARLQGGAMLLGLVPVAVAAIGGWIWFHGAVFTASWNVSGQSAAAVLPRATVMVFWAFLGVETAIILAVRVRNPLRDVPIGTLAGLLIAALLYMSASAAIMGLLPAAALAKSTAPFADAIAPILGASAAGAIALCAMLKACGTLGSTLLLTVESAESECVLGNACATTPMEVAPRASLANLLFTGVLTSLVAIASASPTLARQFTIVTNVAVVLSLMVYGAAGLALLRLSHALPPSRRFWARATAAGGTLFSLALIAASEPDLLIWSAGSAVLAMLAYFILRARQLRPAAKAA
ncbi:MAG TPA: amino acid permease [Rhizomicrobium sp.]|jgi:arginine:agmatine antiporter|nr:amino acid permease [Rhizomicrobium sp.]